MPAYELRVLPSAEKDLAAIANPDQGRLVDAILALSMDPRPAGHRKMEGYKNMYRIRVGRFRVAYEINDRNRIVIIACAASRDRIYSLLKRR